MTPFRIMCRSARFKAGGEIRVLDRGTTKESADLDQAARAAIDDLWSEHRDRVAGFAVCAWSASGDVGVVLRIGEYSPYVGSAIPGLVADSVRRVLARTDINRALGRPDDGIA